MVEYDPDVIHEHAQRLYDRALSIMVTYAVGYGLVGAIAGAVFGVVADNGLGPVTGVMGAGLLGLLGAAIGRARGFELRLQAQTALCQVQIELNGRAPVASQYGASAPSRH